MNATAESGSSPLARGTRGSGAQPRGHLGLIPARAGNTVFIFPRPPFFWAHPRSRGEHFSDAPSTEASSGSSPLARGTRGFISIKHDATGLIPARAGNTISASFTRRSARAHPRSRGEHRFRVLAEERLLGSSPLARGTREGNLNRMSVQGLIPARAGNTTFSTARKMVLWAHPRSRGEHQKTAKLATITRGSSPLARGTRQDRTAAASTGGLIPARAGNTQFLGSRSGAKRAHPRSRGEHSSFSRSGHGKAGSSPLARGTLLVFLSWWD